MPEFVQRSRIPVPAEFLFDWHARPGALQRLTPPWESVRIVSGQSGANLGDRVTMKVTTGPATRTWVAEVTETVPGRLFVDVQREGPFARWEHRHIISPDGPDACWLEDRISYKLPLGLPGELLAGAYVRGKLERAFAWRHALTSHDVVAHYRTKAPAMKIAVTGSTGLVGSRLLPFLTTGGHQVFPVTRSQSASQNAIRWDIEQGTIEKEKLEGLDAVIHLAGEGIAEKRWTEAQKAKIRNSRVHGTSLLARTLAELKEPPNTLICASAIGYYGNRGDEELTENSSPGTGFLAEVCRAWEEAANPARAAGIRTVHCRIGLVLSTQGGALKPMLLPFKLGVGGKIGNGRQWWSWVALDDLVGILHHCLTRPDIAGPVNSVSPNPVTNAEFTKTLGQALHRPTILPTPPFGMKLLLGSELVEQLILASSRVAPEALLRTGYQFRYPDLESALRHALGKERKIAVET